MVDVKCQACGESFSPRLIRYNTVKKDVQNKDGTTYTHTEYVAMCRDCRAKLKGKNK